jgi:hypothetical protein
MTQATLNLLKVYTDTGMTLQDACTTLGVDINEVPDDIKENTTEPTSAPEEATEQTEEPQEFNDAEEYKEHIVEEGSVEILEPEIITPTKPDLTKVAQQTAAAVFTPSKPPELPPEEQSAVDKLLKNINSAKETAVLRAADILNDPQIETKELKDLVAVLDTLEKSLKGTAEAVPTVNIMVQNIMSEFQDDC